MVQGDLTTRTAQVLREGVDCPSLSPDETRIAFNKRVGQQHPPMWQLSVLDLRTGEETPLAETQSVDDQAEWLDNNQVLYTRGETVWVVPADGSGAPRPFLTNATSPAVVHEPIHELWAGHSS